MGFTGAYDDPAALMLGTLDQLDGLTRSSVTLPDGGEARDPVCLGSVAHHIHGADWFSFDLPRWSDGGPLTTFLGPQRPRP